MRARAVNPRQPHEMTRAESAWSTYGWFVEGFANRRYEGYTLRLGENRITPDFSGVDVRTGQLCFFEVKASNHPAVYTDVAKLRLRTAASEFAELRFHVCWPIKGSKMRKWHVEEIGNRSTRLSDKPLPQTISMVHVRSVVETLKTTDKAADSIRLAGVAKLRTAETAFQSNFQSDTFGS